jgi:hypothetical protein
MENTALKMSPKELVKEFKEAHGNLDLARVFLITGSADISRSYELVTKWAKNAVSTEDKAKFNSALKILQNIELRRILLTEVMYKADDVQYFDEIASEENKTILMLPKLDDLLERVGTMLRVSRAQNFTEEAAINEAFELLKTSVGQGKAIDTSGKPVAWDNNQINDFINSKAVRSEKKETTLLEGEKFGFETIYGHFSALIEAGKEEPEIKVALKEILVGKTVKGRDKDSDTVIKDEKVFEDYYTRILSNIILLGIKAKKEKLSKSAPKGNPEEIAAKVEAEIKPFLEEQEKDPTQTSLASTTRKMQAAYKNLGIEKSLRDLFFTVKELAEKYAPGLAKRNKTANKDNVPVTPLVDTKKMSVEGPSVEIYDDTHNIKESNKPLWEEVEKYTILNDVFVKAQELYKAGNWKDALSMSILLITEGKIKETESSKEVMKWDTDQIKQWFHTIVEASVTGEPKKVIDVKAEVIKETNPTQPAEKTAGNVTSTKKELETADHTSEVSNESKQQGPVPQAGSLDSKEVTTRTLKDNSAWKDKYQFKSFLVKTDHYRSGAMSLEIVDATSEQEKDLFITEHNMTKFFDEQRDRLIVKRNEEKDVRNVIKTKLSEFYEITSSEAKRIVGKLVDEADAIRRENKKASKEENPTQGADKTVEDAGTTTEENAVVTPKEDLTKSSSPVEEQQPSSMNQEAVQPITGENAVGTESIASNVQSPTGETKDPIQPADAEKSKDVSPETTTVTDKSAGEEHSNSNKETVASEKPSYEGFEAILNAKKKFQLHVAIYEKVNEYAKPEEGIKAVYDVINDVRKDNKYKKSYVHNYVNTSTIDILTAVNNAYTTGVEHAKIEEKQ